MHGDDRYVADLLNQRFHGPLPWDVLFASAAGVSRTALIVLSTRHLLGALTNGIHTEAAFPAAVQGRAALAGGRTACRSAGVSRTPGRPVCRGLDGRAGCCSTPPRAPRQPDPGESLIQKKLNPLVEALVHPDESCRRTAVEEVRRTCIPAVVGRLIDRLVEQLGGEGITRCQALASLAEFRA